MVKLQYLERTKELVLGLFIISGLRCLCAGQNDNGFNILPNRETYVVTERGKANLSCLSSKGQNISSVLWKRDEFFICKTTFMSTGKCKTVPGPSYNNTSGGETDCSCKIASSTLIVDNVTMDDANNWTCRSEGLKITKRIQMVVLKPGAMSPSTETTVSASTLPNRSITWRSSSSSPRRKFTSVVKSAAWTSVLHTVPTTPRALSGRATTMTTTSSSSVSNSSDTSTPTGRSDRYQIYIVVGVVAGLLLLLVIIIIIVVKTRSHRSGPDRKMYNQRPVRDELDNQAPEDDELVIEENVIYSSGPLRNVNEVVDNIVGGPGRKMNNQRLVNDEPTSSASDEDELVMEENVIYCSGPSDNMNEAVDNMNEAVDNTIEDK